MDGFAAFRLLLFLSLRNLWTHRTKTLIVGAIMFFGTLLAVLGTALLDSVERSMSKSITSSMVGHLQVYSDKAEDELTLFGSMAMGDPDMGTIADFSKVRDALEQLPNVSAVVPMGLGMASVNAGNEVDQVLESLRAAVKIGDARQIAQCTNRIHQVFDTLAQEQDTWDQISGWIDRKAEYKVAADHINAPGFWEQLKNDPAAELEFLETKLAPLVLDSRLLYLRYLGTDLARFATYFDRFKIVDGGMVPPGERGILLSKRFYEEQAKNLVARELDKVHKALTKDKKKLAHEPTLRQQLEQVSRQYSRITYQLNADDAAALETDLRKFLPGTKGGLNELVQALLTMDDGNFETRYRFFYDKIAPRVQIYDLPVGRELTLKTYTRSGYSRAVNIKIYGTFEFTGLEEAELAGATNLTDLMTFRDLMGLMTPEKMRELEDIRKSVGVKAVAAEDAEAALFGGGTNVVSAAPAEKPAPAPFPAAPPVEAGIRLAPAPFTQNDIDHGVAINAAILLKDPALIKQTQQDMERLVKEQNLGLKVIDWQKAAGIVGQIILLVRGVLYVAIFIIFIVASVIINNSMVMATLERVREIGTLRALGAQRRLVLMMFLLETVLLGNLAGGPGALVGAALVKLWGIIGIPAGSPILVLLFAGPRLYPTVGVMHLVWAFVLVLLVSLASTLYPAFLATRIQPVTAMQKTE